MEKNDHSADRANDREKSLTEETVMGKQTRSRPHWREGFKRVIQKNFLLFKNLMKKVKSTYKSRSKMESDVSTIEDIKGAFGHIPLKSRGMGFLFVGFLFTIYLLSGVYTVEPGEVAVSTIFGKKARQSITEGLHYRLPWPFEVIEKVNVSKIRRVDVGLPSLEKPRLFPKTKNQSLATPSSAGAHAANGGNSTRSLFPESTNPGSILSKNQFFTGDENILEIRMNIQYQIKDAPDYLFNTNSPDYLVPSAIRAAVTEFFGGMPVEDLLTVAKSQIQRRIALKAQSMLDEYRTGLYIVSVNLQEVNPPKEVAQAFRDVAGAKEQREETINKAQGYWNTVIPEARGNAHKMVSDAEGYKEEVINQSRGDAEKFSAMLNEYRRAKNVTEYRLYLETMELILAKAKKFVVDSKRERVNLKFVK